MKPMDASSILNKMKRRANDVFDAVRDSDSHNSEKKQKLKSVSVDPLDVLSERSKEFLIASMNIRTSSEFLEAKTSDIANALIQWRVDKQMPAMKGKSASVSINAWKRLVRSKPAANRLIHYESITVSQHIHYGSIATGKERIPPYFWQVLLSMWHCLGHTRPQRIRNSHGFRFLLNKLRTNHPEEYLLFLQSRPPFSVTTFASTLCSKKESATLIAIAQQAVRIKKNSALMDKAENCCSLSPKTKFDYDDDSKEHAKMKSPLNGSGRFFHKANNITSKKTSPRVATASYLISFATESDKNTALKKTSLRAASSSSFLESGKDIASNEVEPGVEISSSSLPSAPLLLSRQKEITSPTGIGSLSPGKSSGTYVLTEFDSSLSLASSHNDLPVGYGYDSDWSNSSLVF